MKWRRYQRLLLTVLFISSAGLAVVVWGAKPPDDPPGNGAEASELSHTIADLSNPDYAVQRDAIRKINGLVQAPNIQKAVSPLIDIAEGQNGAYDPYTRCMAVHSLVGIALVKGGPHGNRALEAVVIELASGDVDIVRAASATALSVSNWQPAYEPLISANETDPSPLVRQLACEALTTFTNGQYSSPTCAYDTIKSSSAQSAPHLSIPGSSPDLVMMGVDALSAGSTAENADMIRWMGNHVLMPPGGMLQLGQQSSTGETK